MRAAVTEPRPALLRVADAPPLPRHRAGSEIHFGSALLPYQILLVMLLIHFSSFLVAPGLAMIQPAMVIARYLLWPCIAAMVIASLGRIGVPALIKPVAPVAVYLLVGIVSALFSLTLFNSLRFLFFWTMGVMAASTMGQRIPPERTMKALFAAFAAMVTLAAVVAIALPDIGLQANSRSATGYSWRGLFPGKNQLGEICAYALLFTMAAPGISFRCRAASVVAGWLILLQTNSQSALVVAATQAVYWLALAPFRRLPISQSARVLAWLGFLAALASGVMFGKELLLAMLGRDATLTGRSEIWRMWFTRASEHWFLGAGPGSFTSIDSPVTRDLALAFQTYGVINTPHNMYIAIFGEIGLLGLMAFLPPLVWFLLVAPFRHPGREGKLVGAVALTMLLGGLGETHEVFGSGINMILLVLTYAAACAAERNSQG